MRRIIFASLLMVAVIVGGSGQNVSAINITECCDKCCPGGFTNVGDPHILFYTTRPNVFYMKVLLANDDNTSWQGSLEPLDNTLVISLYQGTKLIFQEQLPVGFMQETTTDPARPTFRFFDRAAAQSGGFETLNLFWNLSDQGWQLEARIFDFSSPTNLSAGLAQLRAGPTGLQDVELTLIVEVDDQPFCTTGLFRKVGGNKLDLRLPAPVR